MTTHTRSRTASAGRFHVPTARRPPSRAPRRRSASAGRAMPRMGRRQQKQSTMQKLAGTVGGLFGGASDLSNEPASAWLPIFSQLLAVPSGLTTLVVGGALVLGMMAVFTVHQLLLED